MSGTLQQSFLDNFLGNSPKWYKMTIIGFLILNPIAMYTVGPHITGWMLIGEFILTLAMALKCYPLQPGGLLAIEAIAIGLAGSGQDEAGNNLGPHAVYLETIQNFDVILLLMFMVAGIFFMKDLLLFVFTKILLNIKSKVVLSFLFAAVAAVLSAFLDALTVTAVLITVSVGFYTIYHRVASGKHYNHTHDHGNDEQLKISHRHDLEEFRRFLRSLLMHGAIGTALGGVCTLVGEPQNLLIAQKSGWNFIEFLLKMAPVTLPVLVAGLLTTIVLELTGWFGYGTKLPSEVRRILEEHDEKQTQKRTNNQKAQLIVQGLVGLFLCFALAQHIAAVGIIGLAIIVMLTAFNGIVEEHQIGKAFEEALPFTSLLVVFFAIVAVIHQQHLFTPVIDWVLSLEMSLQPGMFFIANGVLSMISDNVFVATVYIGEVHAALEAGTITREHYDKLAIAINTGTNLPSVATPNGQAAFLFLLTSAIAPLVRLSYGRMVIMALPYTLVLSVVGFFCVTHFI